MNYNLKDIDHSPKILKRCGPILWIIKSYIIKLIAKFPISTVCIVAWAVAAAAADNAKE